MKVLLAHPGTQYSGRVAAELARLGVLGEFHTGIAIADGGFAQRALSLAPHSLQRRFANRRLPGVPASRVRLHPFGEMRMLWHQRRGASGERLIHERNARFQDHIGDASLGVDAVIGFDTSAWKLAARCRDRGVPLILDQSIGHPDSKSRVYAELRRRYPAWSHDADDRLPEVRQAEQVEHESSSLIVAASSFSRNTLVENGIDAAKIVVNAYGVDCERFAVSARRPSSRMRLCFVGSMTVRKGVAQLLAVWDALAPRNAELWLVGPASRAAAKLLEGHPNVVYKGAVPHPELPAILAECDAFVFPSFFEGFALVILEAMACGLPVITTDATAGPDIIRNGEDGWVIGAGDDDALARAIEFCLSNPGKLAEAGIMARRTAERFTWRSFGDRWMRVLTETVACSRS